MDQDRLKEFQFRMFSDAAGALAGILMHVGDRTGLFKAMAGRSAMTAEELAAATTLQPRYVLEWLSAMAARKVIDYDASTGRFSLPEEHAAVLVDEDSAVFTGSWFQTLPDFYAQTPDLVDAFREGGGVSSEMSPDLLEGFSRARRAVFRHQLTKQWLPLSPVLTGRLEEGARVADIACGVGHSTIIMAKAFPTSRFVGFDIAETALRLATRHAAEAGIGDRVEFRLRSLDESIGDREYDLATLFDCVHDFADPVRALRNVRKALKPGGSGLVQELNVGEGLADNLNPFGAFIYTVSTLHCMSQSLGHNGAGLGAAMAPSVLRRIILDAGFASLDRLSLKHPLYALYQART
jgi:2-polyprenyl-3-methyl-5-hydroxy-6-metoxy-1,4-benzoquinol methylase